VLAASAFAAFAALICIRSQMKDPGTWRMAGRSSLLRAFARYAVPLVAASAIYQLLPVVNRMLLADRAGFAQAGYFSLASEIGMRLFQNLGSALDLVLFQLAVRADELHGREHAENQITRNMGMVTALLWPSAVGFWLVLPSFEAVFVPASFKGQFAPAMEVLIPALAGFALIQYALNPIFQLRARTAPVVAASAVALVVDLAIVLARPEWATPQDFARAQLGGLGAALIVLAAMARSSGARLPWRDILSAGTAASGMGLVLWPLRTLEPSATTLALQVVAGALAYAAFSLALDVAGARSHLARAARRVWLSRSR
jgi:O-antigen/teichoic acid export membrane protein